MKQKEFIGIWSILKVNDILAEIKPKNIFLVTGKSSYSASGAKNILDIKLSNDLELLILLLLYFSFLLPT